MSHTDFSNHALIDDAFFAELNEAAFIRSRILIVTDGILAVTPQRAHRGVSYEFGPADFIERLRSFSTPTSLFDVTVATRNGVATQPISGFDLTGFRFNPAVLAKYDQVWLFGYNPGNIVPDSLDPGDDSYIFHSIANPVAEIEIAALADWMEAGGGVFAAGDHHILGASMCVKVPRVNAMRHWTIEQGVPTFHFETRLDTTRPATPEETAGLETIYTDNEEDGVPQRIEWVPHMTRPDGPATVKVRPHPLLCHPTLGVIDILPDHPHEGRCHVFDAAWKSEFAGATNYVRGAPGPLFPSGPGGQELPKVIAWGHTLAGPPLKFQKGAQPPRRFAQIAVYDGRAAGVGRVVVDATWHHWFDLNMAGIELRAYDTGDHRDLERIRRYHINVAIWLAQPAWRLNWVHALLKRAQFSYFGQERFSPRAAAKVIGRDAAEFLGPLIGPCWVTQSIIDQIDELSPRMVADLTAALEAGSDSELPAHDLVLAALGGVVRALYSDMDELRAQLAKTGKVRRSPFAGKLAEQARAGALAGLREELAAWRARLRGGVAAYSRASRILSSHGD